MGIQRVSFTLSGRTMTKYARDLVLSGKWREGVAYLRESLEGFTLDHAVSVLDGSRELTGDSRTGVNLEDDVSGAAYREELDGMFSGLVRMDGALCRASAVVASYGDRDMRAAPVDGMPEFVPESFHGDPRLDLDALRPRAMHYAEPGQKVEFCEVLSVDWPGVMRKMAVLFTPVHDVPMWVLPVKDAQAAADARAGDLKFDGFQKRYGSDDLSSERSAERMTAQAKLNFAEQAPDRFRRDNMRERLDQNLKAQSDRSRETFDQRRRDILRQNEELGFGLRRFDFGEGVGERDVPIAPLLVWAIHRFTSVDRAGLVPDWKPVCPQGVKELGDDPVHSDWVVGAGLEEHSHLISETQNDLMARVQDEVMGLKVNVLVGGRPSGRGKVVYVRDGHVCGPDEVAVIPNAGPKYYEAVRNAAAVIALKGGAMSHLAVVGLEEGMLLVRIPDAKDRFPEGSDVKVDAVRGDVSVFSYPAREEGGPDAAPRP